MLIFDKDIKVKDYDCSFNPNEFQKKPVKLNLYVQMNNKCNAKCDFCNPGCIDSNFDFDKLEEIIHYLHTNHLINRISITGGEPLLNPKRLKRILKIAQRYPYQIALNTNGFNLDILEDVYDDVDRIFISKHHYNNQINDSIMKIHTPTIEDLSSIDVRNKITLHCVLQKGYIDNAEKMKQYMDYMGTTYIRNIKFISLYQLTDKAIEKMIEIQPLMDEFSQHTNAGVLYDKCYCSCLDFVYVTSNGKVINAILRNNKTNHFHCCRQLVFNGENLYDGFEKKILIK